MPIATIVKCRYWDFNEKRTSWKVINIVFIFHFTSEAKFFGGKSKIILKDESKRVISKSRLQLNGYTVNNKVISYTYISDLIFTTY